MMVSTRGRYALRLIMDIAKQGQAGALVTMRQSAERLGLSVKYLEQLGGALVRGGVLKSIRGANGGYYLERPPAEICIGDVLRATEGSCMPVAAWTTKPCANGLMRARRANSGAAWETPSRTTWIA